MMALVIIGSCSILTIEVEVSTCGKLKVHMSDCMYVRMDGWMDGWMCLHIYISDVHKRQDLPVEIYLHL